MELEKYYIELFKPELNNCKVKKYLPKQPQVEREIKRLLKVLNTPTLYPLSKPGIDKKIRSNKVTRCVSRI